MVTHLTMMPWMSAPLAEARMLLLGMLPFLIKVLQIRDTRCATQGQSV
jgi:hypothetical protein